jgi:hypothetical protein
VNGETFWARSDDSKAFEVLHRLIDELQERAKSLTGPENLEINFEAKLLTTKSEVSDLECIAFDE